MSDIGILNDPLSLIAIALIFGSPGIVLGAIAGALLWRRRRIGGGLIGAIAGFILWLTGWMLLRDVI